MKTGDNNLNLPLDPIEGLNLWLRAAEEANLLEPTAMTLATATKDGRPSARIVLFKGFSEDSTGRKAPRFFTNYTSRKSEELLENPRAALVFFWAAQARQIRVEGKVEKLSDAESDQYFQSRPRGSRIGAWASPQSQKIEGRERLDDLVAETEDRFDGKEIPCPPFWGGWRLIPERMEFWQGVNHRLHDRFVFEWTGQEWISARVAP
jgi:pyridoxamine 5'-phosphate oxidase